MLNVFCHPDELDKSISNLRVVGWYYSILLEFKRKLSGNSGEPDLVLHCLPMSHKKVDRLIWVKVNLFYM